MSEHWTCIECEDMYDDTDGDTDERMCNECIDEICDETPNKQERVDLVMREVDELIDLITKK